MCIQSITGAQELWNHQMVEVQKIIAEYGVRIAHYEHIPFDLKLFCNSSTSFFQASFLMSPI